MKKTVLFYFLVILTFFLFLFCFLKQKNFKSYIMSPYNTMNVILEAKTKAPDDVILEVNNQYFQILPSKNVLNKTLKGKVESLNIIVKDGFEKDIKNIVIFNDIKVHYFKDFSSFEAETFKICPQGKCSIYKKYKVPNLVKYNKNHDSYNFRSCLNAFCSFVLSILSGSTGFFIAYIMLFLTLICYINYKNELKIPCYCEKIFIATVFVFAFLMYFNGIFDYLPWLDEYRTIEYCNPKMPLSTLFSDPGNPAIFYILFRIFISLFGISVFTIKIFPFLISILALTTLFYFLKLRFCTKTALLGIFLAAINIPLIYYAQETRSYILQAAMTPIIVLFVFNIIEKNRFKDYIIYAVLVAIASNIHYYEILFLISNFIFVSFYFIFKKRYKDILKFTLANIIGALFFLPFFLYTAFNKALMDSSFNTWIPDTNFLQIKKCVYYIFGGFFGTLLSIIFFIHSFFKERSNKNNIILIYAFFSIVSTITLGIMLSYLIRPMLHERYLVLLCPLIIIFLCCVFTSKYKNKYMPVLFLIWIILMQSGSFEKYNRKKGVIEEPLNFSKQYIEKENPKENIYSIVNLSNPEYLENKEDILTENINYISISKFEIEKKIDEILNKDENAIIFTSLLEATEKNSKKGENYYCYFNSTTDMCLWKIKNLKQN